MTVPSRRADEAALTLRTGVPLVGASADLEIVLWNPAAEALLGFTLGEVIGRRCFDVLGCPGATRRLYCAAGGRRPGACSAECAPGFETEVSTRSGERMSVSVTTLLAASGGDEPVRLHLLRETRREHQLEELLRQLVSAAARLSPTPGDAGGAGARALSLRGFGAREPVHRGVTVRELEVVKLLAQGSSTGDIAAQLGISCRTARNHIQNILGKLHVHSRLEAVAYASARGLV
jgi:DNA-binding CsgD family transcriptional regulator